MLDSIFTQYDRVVVLDTETTGIDCRRDEIIELAAVAVGPGGVEDEMDLLIRLTPGRRLPGMIVELTGITEQMLADEGCEKAQAAARAIFAGGGSHADMPSTKLSDGDFTDGEIGILAMMVKGGLAASNGEARRLVQQGGVSVNDEKVTDPKFALKKSAFENEVILKKGKKVFHKFVI